MIVLEGPDGGGKTTLLKHLNKELEVPIAARAASSEGGPVTDLHGWTTRSLNAYLRNKHPRELHDRYPLISEPIYGPLVRGAMRPGFGTVWYSDAWNTFLSLRPTIIFCLPPVQTVVRNVDKEDGPAQMDGVVMNIRAIYWQYYTLMQRLRGEGKVTVILWDYTHETAAQHMQMILGHLKG